MPPSTAQLLAYRLFGWRLGPDHRDWVHDDLERRGWIVRAGAPVAVAMLVLGFVIGAVTGDAGVLLPLVVVLLFLGALLRHQVQERARRQQGLTVDGDPLPDQSWYDDPAARQRRNLVSAGSTVVLVVAAMVLFALRHH